MIILTLCCLAFAAPAAAGLVVVVHPDVNAESISDDDLRRIFLGKRTRWSGGEKIVPVVLEGGAIHREFVEEYLDRSVAKYVTYWKQAVFTGRGVPPRAFASEDELRFYVSRTPGAVGYLDEGSPHEGVRVLQID
jgi:ABC-type phosphate transport system substrate-binding protein